MVYSASIATAEASRYTGYNAACFLARHGVFLALALAGGDRRVPGAGALLAEAPRRGCSLRRCALLVAGADPRHRPRGERRARAGSTCRSSSVQPSELMKLAVVLYAADYTVRKHAVHEELQARPAADARR